MTLVWFSPAMTAGSLVLFTGLFEKHKLLYSFNMTIKIEQADHRVPQDELDFFLKGN